MQRYQSYPLRSKGPLTEVHTEPKTTSEDEEEVHLFEDQDHTQSLSTMEGPSSQQLPISQGRPPFKIDVVGKFDPHVSDAKTWLERYQYFGRISGTTAEHLARFFGMYLTMGLAFDWFTCLTEEIKSDFDQLKEKFLQRFGKKIDPVQVLADLFQMKQKPKQSVRDFVYAVQSKAHLADISGENVLSAITGGLLPHIKADLRRKPPTNLEELIETAEISESAYEINPAQINFSEEAFTEIVKNAIGNVNMVELKNQVDSLAKHQAEINLIQNQNKRNFSRQQNFSKKSSYQNNKVTFPVCRACGRTQPHDFSTCFAKSKNCYFCNRLGHIKAACEDFKRQHPK